MRITIQKDRLRRIETMSRYNHNYYMLPFEINNCNIFYEEYDEMSEQYSYSIGSIHEGKNYIPAYWIDIEIYLGLYRFSEKDVYDKDIFT